MAASITTAPSRVAIPATVALYLGAIVAANLLVAHFGPSATPYVAFALIGADLTSRDALQELWGGQLLPLALLIVVGGLISYTFNAGTEKIALASTVAFVAAATIDTFVYTLLEGSTWQTRVAASNIASAAVDSVLFLWIAFGLFGTATFAQFTAKVAGGAVWALALSRARR